MKKEFTMIVLAILVIISVVFWFTSTTKPISISEIAMYGALMLIVGFAVFIAIRRMKAAKEGLTTEDELSKKVLQKASSMAFYTSLYWWLFLMYFTEKSKFENHTQIGVGILGMAVLFAAFWVYYNYKGKFNE